MALSVGDIRELPVAKSFRLVCGNKGLNREINYVNLMDFEYDLFISKYENSGVFFDKNSIIITSLLFAKDDPNKIIQAIRQLYLSGVSAVAIKEVYYKQLPEEVIKFANEKALPIFMFESEKNYLENIVVELTTAIKEQDNIDILEEKLKLLLNKDLGASERMRLTDELFSVCETPFRVYYLFPQNVSSDYSYHHMILSLRNLKDPNLIIFPYQKGILALSCGQESLSLTDLYGKLNLPKNGYCGISRRCTDNEEIAFKIKESIYACRYAKSKGKSVCYFEDMGIWQIVLPNQNNYWMKTYFDGISNCLKNYDTDDSCELYSTIVRFVKNCCDFNATANEMLMHKNTIRYRINKAKELLNIDDFNIFSDVILFMVYFQESFNF